MANQNLTPKMIMKQFLAMVRPELIMIDQVYRDYDSEIASRREGDSIYVRAPLNFEVQDGATFVAQDIEQGEIQVKVDQRKHIGFEYSDDDLQLKMPEFVRKYSMKGAAQKMAQHINRDLLGLYSGVYNYVGTPGTTINTMQKWNAGMLRLDQMDVPMSERCGVIDSIDGRSLGDDAATLAASDEEVKAARRKGLINRDASGAMLYATSQVRTHTVGAYAGTPLVDGAGQNVTHAAYNTAGRAYTLSTDGWSSGSSTLNQGDIFTIAGVYSVNPTSKDTLSHLQQFVVRETISDTAGDKDILIEPPIITTGPYQTVSAAPADNAAITVLGTASSSYKQNLAFHKNAFLFVPVPIKVPDSAAVKATVTDSGAGNYKLNGAPGGSGLSFTMVKEFDAKTYKEIQRIDTLYGRKVLRPELATRIAG